MDWNWTGGPRSQQGANSPGRVIRVRLTASRCARWTGSSGGEDEQPRNGSNGAEQEGGQLNSGGGKNKTQKDGGLSTGGQEGGAGQHRDVPERTWTSPRASSAGQRGGI